ncbi:MAG TPA: TetR family transcriptional regulator [Solirubrobacteraceae bacterium]|nr:TetR family transcriptional regulator [Solirubrobacteraceae bacterium]
MDDQPRRLRADAERNRQRLIEAATDLFRERGLEVGVGEIAERAGVGRGTLFRNFPSKDALVVAVVVERIRESIARGRALLAGDDPAAGAFALIDEALERQEGDRALFEALAGDWIAYPEIREAHDEMLGVLGEILARAQAAGAIRSDVSGVDVMLAVKGVCEVQRLFPGLPPDIGRRQLELVKAALTPHADDVPLTGAAPCAQDLDCAVAARHPEAAERALGDPERVAG